MITLCVAGSGGSVARIISDTCANCSVRASVLVSC